MVQHSTGGSVALSQYYIITTMASNNLDWAEKQFSSLYQEQQKLQICLEMLWEMPTVQWAFVCLLWSCETPNILKVFVSSNRTLQKNLALVPLHKSPSHHEVWPFLTKALSNLHGLWHRAIMLICPSSRPPRHIPSQQECRRTVLLII